jgi:predicted nucleic acid-binding protein
MSQEIIIADTSYLIVLQNIQELPLLQKLFGEIFITKEVEEEFRQNLPEWIKIKAVQNKAQRNALNLILDKGEASSIALCLETNDSLLVIDEKKGRRIALQLGLKITGTLGVVLRAQEKDLIGSIEKVLEKLENAEFWISPNLKAKI